MKAGDRVTTPHGGGIIVDIEHYSRISGGTNRYGVKHDVQRFSFPVAYYWPSEIQKAGAIAKAAAQ